MKSNLEEGVPRAKGGARLEMRLLRALARFAARVDGTLTAPDALSADAAGGDADGHVSSSDGAWVIGDAGGAGDAAGGGAGCGVEGAAWEVRLQEHGVRCDAAAQPCLPPSAGEMGR